MKPNLLIRADGSTQIGLGHIFRCLALSQFLKDHYQITFVSKLLPNGLEGEFDKSSLKLKIINDEDEFFFYLSPGLIVILDGYQFNTEYQNEVTKIGCRLCCIDDIHDREFAADLIINHSPGITKEDYIAKPDTQFALGTDYVLLRQPFIAYSKAGNFNKNSGSLFICFGGSDEKNLTVRVLDAAVESGKFSEINVVTGPSYRHEKEMFQKTHSMDRVSYYRSLSEQKMADRMSTSEFAVVPASGILFEALATGCKVISGTYVNNQKKVYEGFKKMNAIIDAGMFGQEKLHQAFEKADSFTTKKIIDGRSPERLLSLFKELSND